MIFEKTLENGIRVVAESMEHYRSVAIGVWVNTGSAAEKPEQLGASHFIEHMLFKGTSKRSASDIAAQMDMIGGNMNAFTSKECTCFYAKVLDEHIGIAIDILADIVTDSVFDEREMEKEKGVVIEEIAMVEDTPEDLVHDALCETFFVDTPLEKPILGYEETVSAFTRAGLMEYLNDRYTPENIVIACAGSFDFDRLMELIQKGFGDMRRVKTEPMRPSAFKGGNRFKPITKDIEQAHICVGMPGYRVASDEQYPLFVLNNALGGSMSSRLFQKIREQRGLAYSVYSYPSGYRTTGSFVMYAGCGEKQAEQVTKLMLDEIAQIKANGLDGDEFQRAKEQLKGSFALGQESTSAHMNYLGKAMLLKNELLTEEQRLERIQRVTLEDINSIIPFVFDDTALCAAYVGRANGQEGLVEKLIIK